MGREGTMKHSPIVVIVANRSKDCCISLISYIKPQHVLRLVLRPLGCISLISYIKPQHSVLICHIVSRCISLISYIKPQPLSTIAHYLLVVYLLYPTSNHNRRPSGEEGQALYISYILHQTTTYEIHYWLY